MYTHYQLLILTKGELIGEDEAIRNIPSIYTVSCNSAYGELLEISRQSFKELIMKNESSSRKIKDITRKKIGLQENRRGTSRTILCQIERGAHMSNAPIEKHSKKATLRVRNAVFNHFNKINSATMHRNNAEEPFNTFSNHSELMLPSTKAKLNINENSVPKPLSRGKHINIFMARRTLKELLKKKAYYNFE